MKMKKVALIALVLTAVLSTTAFAASFNNPAEMIASLNDGVTTDEIYDKHVAGKTYGEIAQDVGVWEQFKELILQRKLEIVDERVADGSITEEEASTLKETLTERAADCDGAPAADRERLGLGIGGGMGFGKGQGRHGAGATDSSKAGQGYSRGNGRGYGRGRWGN